MSTETKEIILNATAQRMANALGFIAEAQAGNIEQIEDWYTIKSLVDHSLAKSVLPVGYQIEDVWHALSNDNGYVAPWDVVHHYNNGDMALNWHYALKDSIAFDAPEAIFYAPAGGVVAGQYYITIGLNYGNGWVAGHHINVTFPNALDAGDQLVLSTGTDSSKNPTNVTWNVYAKGSTVSKMSGVTTDSSEGTELGSTSTSGTGYTNGNINAPQRVVYGYGRWSQSAIRQYLNSDAAINAWWTPQNGWDRPPAQLSTVRGWMAGISPDLRAILRKTTVTTAINTVEGAASNTETTADYFFLPSLTEWYINPQYAEGEAWDYYKTLAVESGLSGKFAHGSTYPILKKYRVDSTSTSAYVWLRSAYRGSANYAWCVYSSGNVYGNCACNSCCGAPACIIAKS